MARTARPFTKRFAREAFGKGSGCTRLLGKGSSYARLVFYNTQLSKTWRMLKNLLDPRLNPKKQGFTSKFDSFGITGINIIDADEGI